MKCSACQCPGAYELFRGVLCWNRSCRNFHTDVIDGSDFDAHGKTVNGDSVEELKQFFKDIGEEPSPFV